MKNFCFVLLLAFTGVCCSCKNDDDSDLPPIEQLPSQTTVGANTAGCLVNGEVLIPSGRANETKLRCQYAKRQGVYTFGLSFHDKEQEFIKSILLRTENIKLEQGQSYKFLERSHTCWGEYSIEAGLIDSFETDSNHSGILSITHIDEEQRIISGTFSFTAINDQGETIEVTDGRFDMHYIP